MATKNVISFLLFLLIIFYNEIPLFGQTTVSDTVSGIWTKENSPYNVISDIIIPNNKILEIKEGVEIRFNGSYKFVVNGLLIAKGTANDSIKFLPNKNGQFWNGIRFINADSLCSLEYCLIEKSNTIGDSLDGAGGGIYCENTTLNISFCTISNNESKTKLLMLNGGAICSINSNLLMENNIIKKNVGYGGAGGGIYAFNSHLTLKNSSLINNKSMNTDSLKLTKGGAVYLINSTLNIKNNLMYRNYGNSSSAVYTDQCIKSNFINNTIVYNFADNYPSAVVLGGTIQNNIIFFNTINTLTSNQFLFSNADVKFNDIENSFGQYGNSNFDLNPLFANEASDDFHLSEYSPCIDAGNPISGYDYEPEYNGKRINLGCYGNTIEATKSNPIFNISNSILVFDTTYMGQNINKELLIKNRGKTRLNIKFKTNTANFSIDTLNEYSILGNDSLSIPVIYSPQSTSQDSGKIIISDNGINQPDLFVTLVGIGKLGGEFYGILYKKYSPYTVSEILTVPQNKKLIIEPGVVLKFDSLTSLKGFGTIVANGTMEDSIVFEPSSSNPVSGFWNGINMDNNDSAFFKYCRFYYPQQGLNVSRSKIEVISSHFYNCSNYGISCEMGYGNGNQFVGNQFSNCNTGIYTRMFDCLIENNTFLNLNLGLYILDETANVKNNKMHNVGNGIFAKMASILMIDNEIIGTKPSFNFKSDYVFLQYRSDQPLQSFNAELGIVAPPNELSDVSLLNESELGDPNRECIQIIQKPPSEVVDIPQSGYKNSVNVFQTYGTFIIKTKDGGHAKLSKYLDVSGSVIGYGFNYTYVPSGVNKFPGNQFSNGVYLLDGHGKMIGNKISNFYNSGVSFNCVTVDTFINNMIFENQKVGIFFYGTQGYENITKFIAGSSKKEFNEVYNNIEYNLIYSNQGDLNLPYFYWGSESESTISNLIFDQKKLSVLGKVNFLPYLNSSHDTVTVGIRNQENKPPSEYSMTQNYPNPFNPSTIINYEIPKSGLVTIKIYDILGREIETLVNEEKNPGKYKVKFDGSNVSSGLYFYKISSGSFSETKKMLLMK